MGFLMEMAEGTAAGIGDLSSCRALMRRLHGLGLVHRDLNRYNFIVDRGPGGLTLLVDFEHAEGYDEEVGRREPRVSSG
jgi:tRNA A-37 threonylcarbamoyl transferase component Bud32